MVEVAVAGDLHGLEVLEQRRAVEPRQPVALLDDVVAAERAHRDHCHVAQLEPLARLAQLLLDLAEALLGEVDEIHLVHGDDDVWGAEDRGDVGVAAGLLDHALARVDEDDRHVRRGRARDHVPRVLDVARRVRELEAAARGHEGAVGDVDRDPLLALGAETVGEEREVDVAVAATLRGLLDVLQLVGEDLLRVIEEAPDQGGLAVVHRARRHEADELGRHQLPRSNRHACDPPSRPRRRGRRRGSRHAR